MGKENRKRSRSRSKDRLEKRIKKLERLVEKTLGTPKGSTLEERSTRDSTSRSSYGGSKNSGERSTRGSTPALSYTMTSEERSTRGSTPTTPPWSDGPHSPAYSEVNIDREAKELQNKEVLTEGGNNQEGILLTRDEALEDEVLKCLGEDPTANKENAYQLHQALVSRWQHVLAKGLDGEVRRVLLQKYSLPQNCETLQAPKLNVEILSAIPLNAQKRCIPC